MSINKLVDAFLQKVVARKYFNGKDFITITSEAKRIVSLFFNENHLRIELMFLFLDCACYISHFNIYVVRFYFRSVTQFQLTSNVIYSRFVNADFHD